MGGSKYMVGWPAGRPDFSKKRAAGRVGWIDPGSFSFEKPGRPAGQPTMYLDPPIHFGGILLVLVYYWMYFPYYGVFSVLWGIFHTYSKIRFLLIDFFIIF